MLSPPRTVSATTGAARERVASVRSVKSLGILLLEEESVDHASSTYIFVSLFATIVGTGVLAMPRAAAAAGAAGFLGCVTVAVLSSLFGAYLTLRTLETVVLTSRLRSGGADEGYTDLVDIAGTGRELLGAVGFYLSLCVCLLDTWGALVGNICAVADVAVEHLAWTGMSRPHVVAAVALLVSPFTLRERLSDFRWVTAFAMAAMVAFCAVLAADATPSQLLDTEGHPPVGTPAGVASSLSVVFFAFDFQVNLYPLFREAKAKNPAKPERKASALMPPTCAALAGAVLVYGLIGLGGYSTYGEKTLGNIMGNLKGNTAVKVSFALAIFFAIPILVHECNNLLLYYLLPSWFSRSRSVPSFIMLTSAAVFATVFDVYSTFKYVGATVGVTFTCILPPFYFLLALGRRRALLHSPTPRVPSFEEDTSPLLGFPSPTTVPYYSRWEPAAALGYLICGLAVLPYLVLRM